MPQLTEAIVKSFRVAKVFHENTEPINSMDFSVRGDILITSSYDDQIMVYDCQTGTRNYTRNSKKYGVDFIKFTHARNTVLHSSTKYDHDVRYLSLYDYKYIRFFPGHTQKVVCLDTHPFDDTFLSCAMDKTMRIWDLRSPNSIALMSLPGRPVGRPVAAFDPQGVVIAVGVNSEKIHLFDIRMFQKGPFTIFKFVKETSCEWTSFKFSPDETKLLIGTNGTKVRLVDSFHGLPLQTFAGYVNNRGCPIEASFSPDSKFVFCGSTDGKVHVWNAESGYPVGVLQANHPGAVKCVKFHPRYMFLASACENLALWLPIQNISDI